MTYFNTANYEEAVAERDAAARDARHALRRYWMAEHDARVHAPHQSHARASHDVNAAVISAAERVLGWT
jgi:hypothetical protein